MFRFRRNFSEIGFYPKFQKIPASLSHIIQRSPTKIETAKKGRICKDSKIGKKGGNERRKKKGRNKIHKEEKKRGKEETNIRGEPE